jgi:hypothetical protein
MPSSCRATIVVLLALGCSTPTVAAPAAAESLVTIVGRVVWRGIPDDHAEVTALVDGREFRAHARADGSFALAVPRGLCELRGRNGQPGGKGRMTLDLRHGEPPARFDFELSDDAEVEFIAVDPRGQPLGDVHVLAWRGGELHADEVTSSNGAALLYGLPGGAFDVEVTRDPGSAPHAAPDPANRFSVPAHGRAYVILVADPGGAAPAQLFRHAHGLGELCMTDGELYVVEVGEGADRRTILRGADGSLQRFTWMPRSMEIVDPDSLTCEHDRLAWRGMSASGQLARWTVRRDQGGLARRVRR